MFTTDIKKENTEEEALRFYLKRINEIPLLTRKEEEYYAKKMQEGDDTAKNKLIEANLRFVVKTAKKYQGNGLPLEDLIEEGNVGLINATEKFDYNRGYKFISYAVWWIRQSILNALTMKFRTIYLPINRYNELSIIRKELEKHPMRKLSVEEIANKTDISEANVKVLLQASNEPISLDASTKNNDDSYPLIDQVHGSDYEYMQRDLENTFLGEDIQMTLQELTKREQEIIIHRFGLDDNIPESLKEVGDKYGISRERIRQIEKKALRKLRKNTKAKKILEEYLN